MTKIKMNCLVCQTKKDVLNFLQQRVEGMYSANYDALYDALTFYKEPILIEIYNKNHCEDYPNLKELFDDISKQNPNVKIIWIEK